MSFDFKKLDEEIRLECHNQAWRGWYEEEVDKLTPVFHLERVAFEHIGSTAVPGLVAKPIVDIMVGLSKLELSDEQIEALEKLGYRYFGALREGRLFAAKRGQFCFNLQMVVIGESEWHGKLAFRDYLRCQPEKVREYGNAKLNAIHAGKVTLLEYHGFKESVVETILEEALAQKRDSQAP